MASTPLPASLGRLIAASQSLSLRFDRGYDGYDETKNWVHRGAANGQPAGKSAFLESFVTAFRGNDEEKRLHKEMLARRTAALRPLSPVSRTSTSALITGIGRWNPVETGFTFDRFTGSPFLPGSGVKGLLRAAADRVVTGELEGDAAFWTAAIKRIFGEQDQHGAFLFYDAYPAEWPGLEVDVMTPHHSKYYDGAPKSVAADWDEPVPVAFLRVKAKTRFLFWFGPADSSKETAGDRSALEKLLTIALDWLGAGAKTSSGYGWFEAPATPAGRAEPRKQQSLEWAGAVLQYERSSGTLWAIHGARKAYAKGKDLEAALKAELLARLRDRNQTPPRTAIVVVEEFGNGWKIVQVRDENP